MLYYDSKPVQTEDKKSKKCKKEDNDNNKKLNYLSLYRYNLVFYGNCCDIIIRTRKCGFVMFKYTHVENTIIIRFST